MKAVYITKCYSRFPQTGTAYSINYPILWLDESCRRTQQKGRSRRLLAGGVMLLDLERFIVYCGVAN